MGYKIVNKFRFVVSIIILSTLLIVSFSIITNSYKAFATSETEYLEIQVELGDTIWNIAKKYKKQNQDIREFVYLINKVNNISDSIIYPGETIKIPMYND